MRGGRRYDVGIEVRGQPLVRILRDGTTTLGCHLIPGAEFRRIAPALGFDIKAWNQPTVNLARN